MPETELKLFKRCVEFQSRELIDKVPGGVRGVYVLLRKRSRTSRFDVVYVGMARTGVKGRLRVHARSKNKRELWTHFSIFEVFDNVRGEEIEELEGLLRHIYRKDSRANRLNVQRGFKKLGRVRSQRLDDWWSGS
jgi:hypothetical protein